MHFALSVIKLFQFDDLSFALTVLLYPGMAFVVDVADAGEMGDELASGPHVGVVGRLRHHLDNVGVECLGMNAAIAFYIMLGIASDAV